jgi:hypothetical protein
MPVVNRYTQNPQPLILNPLSFEELSRVPLAKAQASAEGVSAINRINTEYNVDDKDLGKVSTMIQGIDENKNKVVEDIASNGVNTQTINDVISLKKTRDNIYKTTINQAEENKKRVDTWRNQVDEMTMRGTHPAWYGELIKSKVYTPWQGSFNEDGTVSTFVGDLGEKYIDMPKDITEELYRASSKGWVKSTPIGGGEGKFEQIQDPTTGGVSSVYTTPGQGERTQASNLQNLEETIKMLKSEYNDPTTERGKYAKYVGLTQEDIDATIDKYKKMYLDTKDVTQVSNKTRQLMDGKNNAVTNNEIPTENLPKKMITNPLSEDVKTTASGSIDAWNVAANKYFGKGVKNKENKSITGFEGVAQTNPLFSLINWGTGKLTSGNALDRLAGFGPVEGVRQLVNAGKVVYEAINHVEDTNKQLELIKFYHEGIKDLINTGKVNKFRVMRALKSNDKEAIKSVWKELKPYLLAQQEEQYTPKAYVGEAIMTEWGLDTKNKPENAGVDLTLGERAYYTLDGKQLNPDEKKAVVDDLRTKNNGSSKTGIIPLGSVSLIDKETGKFIEGLTGGYIVMDSKGNQYMTTVRPDIKDKPEYRRIDRLNKTMFSLSLGEEAPVVWFDEEGNPKQAWLRRSEIKSDKEGHKSQFLLSTDGNNYWEADENSLSKTVDLESFNEMVSNTKK